MKLVLLAMILLSTGCAVKTLTKNCVPTKDDSYFVCEKVLWAN